MNDEEFDFSQEDLIFLRAYGYKKNQIFSDQDIINQRELFIEFNIILKEMVLNDQGKLFFSLKDGSIHRIKFSDLSVEIQLYIIDELLCNLEHILDYRLASNQIIISALDTKENLEELRRRIKMKVKEIY